MTRNQEFQLLERSFCGVFVTHSIMNPCTYTSLIGLCLIWTVGQVYSTGAGQMTVDSQRDDFLALSSGDYEFEVFAEGGGNIEGSDEFHKLGPGDRGFKLTFPNSNRVVELTVSRLSSGSLYYCVWIGTENPSVEEYIENAWIYSDNTLRLQVHRTTYFPHEPKYDQPPALSNVEYSEEGNRMTVRFNEADIKFSMIISRARVAATDSFAP